MRALYLAQQKKGGQIKYIKEFLLIAICFLSLRFLASCYLLEGRRTTISHDVPLGQSAYFIGKLALPVVRPRLTSPFGDRYGRFHEGWDLAVPKGRTIVAAHSGKVIFSGYANRNYGNLIKIASERGLTTYYAHNVRNFVRKGQYVERGQAIAAVGMTGNATGPHVHFETRVDYQGKKISVNPKYFFPGFGQ